MPTTPFVRPFGETGAGEVLVCKEFTMGKEFGMRVRNQVMSLEDAIELLGTTVITQYIDNVDLKE